MTQNLSGISVGCVIMASGDSIRFGTQKLVIPFLGKPLASYIIEETSHSELSSSVVVTRQMEIVQMANTAGLPVLLHAHPLVSDTIRLGVQYLIRHIAGRKKPDGIMFCVADQPLLTRTTINYMIQAFVEHTGSIIRLKGIDLNTGKERFANPVIFPSSLYKELESLPPDETGRYVIQAHQESAVTVQIQDSLQLIDIDTPEQLDTLKELCQTSL